MTRVDGHADEAPDQSPGARRVTVRALAAEDRAGWLDLWASYVAFYGAEVSGDVTATTWARILDPIVPLVGRVAEADGELLGFALCVVHLRTWSETPAAYLEDLFVAATARRRGVARALIDDLREIGVLRRWSTLYWHTREDNTAARGVYDAYGPADGYVRYRLSL